MKPAAPCELLAIVPKPMGNAQGEPRQSPGYPAQSHYGGEGSTHFGDYIQLKREYTLHIGFQNIGEISGKKNKIKDNIICCGIEKFDFDIFGLAEANTNWIYIPEANWLVHI